MRLIDQAWNRHPHTTCLAARAAKESHRKESNIRTSTTKEGNNIGLSRGALDLHDRFGGDENRNDQYDADNHATSECILIQRKAQTTDCSRARNVPERSVDVGILLAAGKATHARGDYEENQSTVDSLRSWHDRTLPSQTDDCRGTCTHTKENHSNGVTSKLWGLLSQAHPKSGTATRYVGASKPNGQPSSASSSKSSSKSSRKPSLAVPNGFMAATGPFDSQPASSSSVWDLPLPGTCDLGAAAPPIRQHGRVEELPSLHSRSYGTAGTTAANEFVARAPRTSRPPSHGYSLPASSPSVPLHRKIQSDDWGSVINPRHTRFHSDYTYPPASMFMDMERPSRLDLMRTSDLLDSRVCLRSGRCPSRRWQHPNEGCVDGVAHIGRRRATNGRSARAPGDRPWMRGDHSDGFRDEDTALVAEMIRRRPAATETCQFIQRSLGHHRHSETELLHRRRRQYHASRAKEGPVGAVRRSNSIPQTRRELMLTMVRYGDKKVALPTKEDLRANFHDGMYVHCKASLAGRRDIGETGGLLLRGASKKQRDVIEMFAPEGFSADDLEQYRLWCTSFEY